jgi:hypothetical protein
MSKHVEEHDTGDVGRRLLTNAEKTRVAEIVRTKWEAKEPGAFVRITVAKETNARGIVRVRITVTPRT